MPTSAHRCTALTLVVIATCLLGACGGGPTTKAAASSGPTSLSTTTTLATTTSTTETATTADTAATASAATATEATLPPDTAPPDTEPATTQPPATTAPAGPRTASITISGSAFRPPAVTVARGGTVTVTNGDGFAHTWTANDGSWDSGPLAGGASYSHMFGAPGTYKFHCSIHSFMTGSVTVT